MIAADEAEQPTITVVIVDDHLLVADSIAAALGATTDIIVLDIADSCESGLAAVARHRPDVLLLDQRLPDGLGTSVLPAIMAVSAHTKALLIALNAHLQVILGKRECFPVDCKCRNDEYEHEYEKNERAKWSSLHVR